MALVRMVKSPKKARIVLSAPLAEAVVDRPLLVDDPFLSAGSIDFQLVQNSQSRKTHQLVLHGASDRVQVTAANFGEHSAATRTCNYAVAVIDTDKRVGRVYNAELLVTQRRIKALDAKPELEAEKPLSRPSTPADYVAARNLLGTTFGTKKTRQAIHSLERNQIDLAQLESASSTFIHRAIDQSLDKLPARDSSPAPSVASSVLPPYNARTAKLEEIYLWTDLIPPDVYEALPAADYAAIGPSDEAAWLQARDRLSMSEYVLGRLRRTSATDVHRIRCLLFLHYLISFRSLKESDINSPAALARALSRAPEVLVGSLLARFSEPLVGPTGKQRYKLSQTCRDRLVSHICVLSLLLDSYRCNLTLMSAVLQMPLAKMVEHFRAVGCAIEKPRSGEPTTFTAPSGGRSLQVKFACLQAPISFSKSKHAKFN